MNNKDVTKELRFPSIFFFQLITFFRIRNQPPEIIMMNRRKYIIEKRE